MPSVFLSPSTQEWNKYLTGGNEEMYMNMLADRMEPFLLASGISFVRNDPGQNVAGAIRDSNAGNFDVHLALHTNAGGGEFAGKLRGIDIYYSPFSTESRELATIIANNLENIYDGSSRALPTTTLGEVTQTRAVAVLAELGYHDNPQDEQWIKNNLTAIARNLVESLTDYFGIPFVESGVVRSGIVRSGGTGLNLRAYPSTTGRIIASIPNGTRITVFGETGNWYVVQYGTQMGYVSKPFVEIINP